MKWGTTISFIKETPMKNYIELLVQKLKKTTKETKVASQTIIWKVFKVPVSS